MEKTNFSNIYVSTVDADKIIKKADGSEKIIKKGQTVNFINVLDKVQVVTQKPIKIPYANYKENEGLILLNYTVKNTHSTTPGDEEQKEIRSERERGMAIPWAGSDYTVDIFKQETDRAYNRADETLPQPITSLQLVGKNLSKYSFTDYNISNNRNYRYKIYLSKSGETSDDSTGEIGEKKTIGALEVYTSTKWHQWSITELHPKDNTYKNFEASPEDVWLFNLNVETGEQTQNILRNEQQTLGRYPKFSQGKLNYVSGSVSCLLGSDVFPMSYFIKNGITPLDGGYLEFRKYASNVTSNQRVDMLRDWRKLVY